MTTVKKAKEIVTTKKTNLQRIEDVLKLSASNLGQALPDHMKPARLNRIVLSMLKMSPKLQECTPISVTAAVFQMAQLGLEPIDGQAHIIPYNNKKQISGQWKTVKEAQFQIGYKGLVTLFYRHMSSVSLHWGIVCENDLFDFNLGTGLLSHKPNLRADRGAPWAYWVKAKLQSGGEIFHVMSKDEILKHAEQHSKAYNKKAEEFYDNTPWVTDFDSMALKTVLIQLMKLLPKSVEIQRAIDMDETTKSRIDADMADVPDETNWGNGNGKTVETTAEVKEGPESGQPLPEGKGNPSDYKTDDQGRLVDPKTDKPI